MKKRFLSSTIVFLLTFSLFWIPYAVSNLSTQGKEIAWDSFEGFYSRLGGMESEGFGFMGVAEIEDFDQELLAQSNDDDEDEGIDFPGSDELDDETPGANLQGADLNRANFQGIYLLWANLRQANLKEANFKGAYLSWANLTKANLVRANLEAANLQGANLEGANMQGANLKKANLQGANLLWTNLGGANLEGANLSETFLSWVNTEGARYNKDTKFPKDFDPKKHGMIFAED